MRTEARAGLFDVMDITTTHTSHPPTGYDDLLDHFRDLSSDELAKSDPLDATCWLAVRLRPLRAE